MRKYIFIITMLCCNEEFCQTQMSVYNDQTPFEKLKNVLFENNTAIKQIQTEKESMQICKHCVEKGVDSIEVSGNGISLVGINEAYFLDFAKKLADEVSIPIILVGGHRSINNMNQILHSMDISFLSMSRPLICEPFLVKRWQENELTPSKCISCNSCYSTFAHRCIFKTLQN